MNRSTYTTKPNTKNKEKIKETVIQNIQKIIEQGIKETLVEETSTGESTFIIGKSKSLVKPNPILEESFPKPTHLLLHKTDKIKKMNKPNLNNPSCLIDILFLVDTSNNSAHTRGSYLDVIRTMISRTIIDSNAIQISIVAFSSKLKQKILFNFQKFSTFNDISTEIEYLQNDSGKPNIGETLNFGGVFLSDANEKTRKDSIKKVVLLSQGYSIDDTLKPVQMLRHNKIDIYCVSVIPRTKSEIQPNTEAMTAIAGDKEVCFSVLIVVNSFF
uniref:VWFA domain-containing protein n=1 Tax=Rhabditophanes sp. KR3021 TaxID=114890 RepID=A0AC35TRM2_9BILA